MIDLTKYTDKEQLFKFLKENKQQLISQKKFEMKRADAFSFVTSSFDEKGEAVKSASSVADLLAKDRIKVKSIINTTKLLDSHGDVHIDGLWKKSVSEQRGLYLLKQHDMSFESVISDSVKASTKNMSWSELGFDFKGSTQALVFDSDISKDRNPYMFEQYAKGYVRNHSVGMRYVQLFLCINDDDEYYREEKANWDKYIKEVANRENAEDLGYFWAVTEAKVIEGSAVLFGSNWATPTQEVKEVEPPEGTPIEPPDDTPMFEKLMNLKTI